MEGTVKWFNRKKGYGFIEGEDGQEYFVHYSGLTEGTFIRDNDIVSFETEETDKGKQAKNVALLQKGSERESTDEEQPAEEEQATEEQATEEQATEEPAEEEQAEE